MLKKEKNIKSALLFLVLFILIVFGSSVSYHQYVLIKNDIKNDIQVQSEYIHKTFNLFLNKLKTDIAIKSDFMLEVSGVAEAFSKQDRNQLYSLVIEQYRRMTTQNKHIKIVTFRLSDGSTFLRVHKPKMFGDKLNKKRKIILDTIATKKRQYGFEVGKLKMTYRVVTPIFYKQKFIGVVEVGVEPENITQNFNKLFKINTALLIKKEDKDISLNKSKMKKIGKYLLARGDRIFLDNLKKIDLYKSTNQIKYKSIEYIIDTSLNLNDNKGKTASKILIAYSIEKYTQKLNHLITYYIPITILMTLLLFIIVNIGLDNFIKKIAELYSDILEQDAIMTEHSKMAAMGEMVESIAHQWRQPLSIITTSASAIKMQKEFNLLDDEKFENLCNKILSSTNHLSTTIDDFRNFYRKDKVKIEFNLKDTFKHSFDLISSKFMNIDISVIKDIQDVTVRGFSNELTQVFINILNNARDELESIEGEKIIFIKIYKDNNNAIIEIKDNAKGIPTEILPKIFDSHFTTKGEEYGTGIGLYMSKKIVTSSFGGEITAKNIEYEYNNKNYSGAQFTITLPVNDK
jgi:signal transduction histidine kinase